MKARLTRRQLLVVAMPLVATLWVIGLLLVPQRARAYVALIERSTNRAVWNSSFVLDQSSPPFPAGTRRAITYSAYQWDDVNTGADFDVDESYYNWDAYVDQADFAAEGWDEHIGGTNINTFLDESLVLRDLPR